MEWLIDNVKRSRVQLILVLVLIGCIFIIPQEARMGLLGLFITKAMGMTMGVLYAHYARLFLFPYLDLSKLVKGHKWEGVIFLTVWYGVIVWAFAVGG
jgi:hypothetical protein